MNQESDTPNGPRDPDIDDQPAVPEEPASNAADAAAPSAAAPTRTPLRERTFRFRSVVAVAAAGLILGAGAGVGTALIADGPDGHGGRHVSFDRMQPPGSEGGPGRRGERNGIGPGMGQLPPGTTQQEEGDDSTSGEDGTSS